MLRAPNGHQGHFIGDSNTARINWKRLLIYDWFCRLSVYFSPSLCVCLSVYFFLSLCLSLTPSVSVCLTFSVSITLFLCHSLSLSVFPFLSLSLSVCFSLVSMAVCLSLCGCPPVCLSVRAGSFAASQLQGSSLRSGFCLWCPCGFLLCSPVSFHCPNTCQYLGWLR